MPKIILLLLLVVLTSSAYANNANYQTCLTPKESYKQCTSVIDNAIASAQKSIIVQGDVFFTAQFIQPLLNAKKRGVKVYRVAFKQEIKKEYLYKGKFQASGALALERAGRVSANANVLLIDDDKLVVTSFSPISSQQKDSINHVLFLNNKNIVKKYLNAWKTLLIAIPESTLKKISKQPRETFVIPQNRRGNYFIYGKVNGTEVRFLIDTGATISAIPEYVAKALKLKSGSPLQVNTAAGKKEVYRSKVNQVQVGSIKVPDLEVVINPHARSGTILLGMNFLRRLDFYIYQGNLYLIQRPRF